MSDDGNEQARLETAVVGPLSSPDNATFDVNGRLKFPGQPQVDLRGTYNSGTRGLQASGGGYTLDGKVGSNNQLTGTYQGPNGKGGFAAGENTTSQPATLYCGLYITTNGDVAGRWNLVTAGGNAFGLAQVRDSAFLLEGTRQGDAISVQVNLPPDGTLLTATATASGTSLSGNWAFTDGTQSGTWSGGPCDATGPAARLRSVSGNNQTGPVGQALPQPIVVKVIDQSGNPVSGVTVTFQVTGGGGALTPPTATTDANGRAQATWTLGSAAGTNTATASAEGLAGSPVTFTATGQGSTGNTGSVSGRVTDPTTQSGIPGVTLICIFGTTPVGQTTSGPDGTFTIPGLPAGTVDLTATLTGRVPVTYIGIVIVINTTVTLEPIPLAPTSGSTGTISGRVTNATDGSPVVGATLELRPGMFALTGNPIATVTSNASGDYAFADRDAGTYTLRATGSGFAPATRIVVSIGGANTLGQDVALSPTVPPGTVRIVLKWGSQPADLDAHLTGPDATGGRFHVYWASPGSVTAEPFARLDLDDTDGEGPETITIAQQRSGVYRFSVHNFENRTENPNSALGLSGAYVDLYIGSNAPRRFNVPNTGGTLWTVFELSGTTVTEVNSLSYQSSPAAVPIVVPHSDAAVIIRDGRSKVSK